MSISKGRRNLILGLAAAGAAGAAGALFMDRRNLARLATSERLVHQPRKAGGKPKFLFVVVADGLGTISFNEVGGPLGGMAGMTEGKEQLWHPWFQQVGNNPYQQHGLDTDDFILAEISNELSAFRNRSLHLRGVRLPTNSTGHLGYKSVLRDNNRSRASIDYLIANGMPDYVSMNKAVYAGHISHNAEFRISYSGAGGGTSAETARQMESNPNNLFRTLFPDVNRSGLRAGAHIFDPALADIRELQQGLSSAEKQKLDVHLDAMEQVVEDLSAGGGGPIEGCQAGAPDFEDAWVGDNARRADVFAAHSKVIAAALACGATRVATYQIGATSEENSLYMEPDGNGNRLLIPNAHQSAHRTVGKDEMERIVMWRESRRWYIRRVKTLLEELDKYPDPDFPEDKLLDHTLVVVTSELADGLPEHQWDMPLQLIGGDKSLGLNIGSSGRGRLLNIRDQAENKESDRWQAWKDQVNLSRVWHTIGLAAGVASGYDQGDAVGHSPVTPLRGVFSGIG